MSPQKTFLYALGGHGKEKDESVYRSISRYDPKIDSWNTLSTKLPFKRLGPGCVSIGNDIFIIGSTDYKATIWKLNTENGKWSELPPIMYPRGNCGAVSSSDGKYIYVAGGWGAEDDWDCSIVERFSIETYEWTAVKPMGVPRSFVELVELSGFIYALGGYNKTAERYDPETDQWSPIAEMNYRHECGHGAVMLEGKIYVLAEIGFEMYSPEEDRWTELPAPAFIARYRRLVALNGELLAVGGLRWEGSKKNKETVTQMNVVECFDVEKQIWSRKADMDIGRADLSVAVVNG